MRLLNKAAVLGAACLVLSACVTTQDAPTAKEMPVTREKGAEAQALANMPEVRVFKRKVAVGRFSNETMYGRAFLKKNMRDPMGRKALDMLSARLVESGQFLVFEREDLNVLKDEQKILKVDDGGLIGVDAVILGSITEFGRKTVGQGGFLSASKKQVAHAKVEIRLADPKTGHVFFSASGQGEANNESSDIMGYGSYSQYDATLNDKAIGAAVTDVMDALVRKLTERPWRTDILKASGSRVFISGGERQGLRLGDELSVMTEGEKIKSAQTGFTITLPGAEVA